MTLLVAYTVIHVTISLIAIAAGFVAMAQLHRVHASVTVTVTFGTMTLLTSLTGFGFPATQITPAHIFGFISIALLATAFFAYSRRAVRAWSVTYILAAVLAQYLNVVVLIVQSFQKLPPLQAIAPPDSQLPIALVQIAVAIGFILFSARAVTLARKLALA